MNREYKNLVFTKHALERLGKRSISKYAIWQTVNYPEHIRKKKKSLKFIRALNDRSYHVVADHLTKENKWLIISVWVRGEDDKLPLIWQIITLPFKILWWILKWFWKAVKK